MATRPSQGCGATSWSTGWRADSPRDVSCSGIGFRRRPSDCSFLGRSRRRPSRKAAMVEPDAVVSQILACLAASRCEPAPFRHWLLDGVLPDAACAAIDELPVAAPCIADTLGKRETNNSTRLFFNAEQIARHPICAAIASGLQSDAVTGRLASMCGVALGGAHLRIEYCLDTDGFWLEPHTDIGAKLFTMLVYLSEEPGCEAWGTDILDPAM